MLKLKHRNQKIVEIIPKLTDAKGDKYLYTWN